MARQFNTKIREEPLSTARMEGWVRGLNTLVSNTQIKPNELSEATDIQLVEDGKIQCPRDGQAYYGATQGSRVTGLFPYYKSDGTKQLLRMTGTALYKYVNPTSWSAVSGFTYTTTLNTNGVMAYDRLYLCNGTDALTYYNGTDITSFSAIAAPAAPTVTRTGSAGSFTFSYKVTAVTAVGETTPSAAGSTTLNQSTLDATSYMTVTWSTVASAIGYNVYGRKDGAWYFLSYVEGNSSTSYVDKNTDTPNEAFATPEGNSTAGPKGKYIAVYKDSLFIFGDPANPSRLYYSGGGDQVNNFTIGGGGGIIDISKNDGQLGTGIIVFKDKLLVFKEDSIYQFSFTTTGLPQVQQVNPAIGAVAPRSIIAVENDVFFASRRGIFTLGNEAGFAFDVLRSNELSAKVRSVVQSIATTYLANISAVYATVANKNLVIFCYTPAGSTTNAKAIVYDRERLAWYKWNNIQANCWANFVDSDGETHVLYGDDSSGYVKEILTGSGDFGSAITGTIQLRAESFKELERYKILKDVTVILRRPSGSVNLKVIKDGTETSLTANISTISPSVNWGHYTFSRFLFAESTGSEVSAADEIVKRTKNNINLEGNSFMLKLDNGSSGASFTLLGAVLKAKPRSERYRKSTDLVT